MAKVTLSSLNEVMLSIASKLDSRMESIETRMGSMENHMGSMEPQFHKMQFGIDAVGGGVREVRDRMGLMDTRFERFEAKVDRRFDILEKDVGDLKTGFESVRTQTARSYERIDVLWRKLNLGQ